MNILKKTNPAVSSTDHKKPVIKFDRLSICFNDPDEEHVKTTCGAFLDDFTTKYTPGLKVTQNPRYRVSAQIPLPCSEEDQTQRHVLFEAGPRRPGISSYRLEMNPAKVSELALSKVLVLMDMYMDADVVEFFRCGKVTRCDLAVDLPGLHLEDVLVRAKGFRKHAVYSDSHGSPQTIYLGTPRSRRVVAYEKPIAGSHATQLRLECRLKPGIFGYQMASLPNPFAKVELIPANFSAAGNLPVHPQFIADSFRIGGLKRALQPLTPVERKALMKAFVSAASELPDLNEAWTKWPSLLIDHGLGQHLGALASHFMPQLAA